MTDAPTVAELLARIAHTPPRGPQYEEMLTVEEAWAMFAGNPGLSSVTTEQGVLHRDGRLVFPRWGTS